jgi:3-oxoacyl-[acyl-carrier-protein] synthase-3
MAILERPLWTGHQLALAGWGHYFPLHRDEQPLDTLPEPTKAETAVVGDVLGVFSRHVASDEETVHVMAARAASQALANAQTDPSEVDLLIVSSWTDRENVPEHGPKVARLLGANRALAFNVGGACIGFVHGVHVAASMLVAQSLSTAVVVAADRFTTRFGDAGWGNRMAGDGAGAAVLKLGNSCGGALHDSIMLSFGQHAEVATVSPRTGRARSLPRIADVAAETASRAVDSLLTRNGLTLAEVDWMVPHPGSQKVLDALRARFDIDGDRVLTNFAHRGTTAGATVPSAVSEYIDSGRLREGDLVVTPSMGAGWFSGALLFTVGRVGPLMNGCPTRVVARADS